MTKRSDNVSKGSCFGTGKFARYMYPDRESVVWMADKLETWRALESGDPDCLLEKEFLSLPFYREAVREFRKRIDACL